MQQAVKEEELWEVEKTRLLGTNARLARELEEACRVRDEANVTEIEQNWNTSRVWWRTRRGDGIRFQEGDIRGGKMVC